MTGPDDHSSTRPISVAELLAKNGTIGAPPVGGRRRRRRGNADAVTVAELTGEIPIIRPDDPAPAPVDEPSTVQTTSDTAADTKADTAADTKADTAADEKAARSANGKVDATEAEPEVDAAEAEPEVDAAQAGADSDAEAELDSDSDVVSDSDTKAEAVSDAAVGTDDTGVVDDADDRSDDYADAVAEYSAHLEQRDAAPEAAPARRFGFGRLKRTPQPDVDAEQMSPDPLDDVAADVDADTLLGAAESAEVDDLDSAAAEADVKADRDAEPADTDSAAADESGLPSYLRSSSEPLFGGQTVADDLARRAGSSRDTDAVDAGDDATDDDATGDDVDLLDEEPDRARPMSSVAHGAWIVGQSVLAVVFGAGLFVAFDQLWKWNNIVALVLSVLVILGLVVGVRVVRKTEDIGSTLIAVAVGALVTLGPLALLQSG